MISRGHFIGQIVDELTAVSSQVRARSSLGLFDLNMFLENFCRDVLNITLGLNLKNLNEENANNAGLDLGDEVAQVGFQITSTTNITKVHKTLENSVKQLDKFKTIYVLMLDKKQGKYKLDEELVKPFKFTEKNILDFDDLIKSAISLPLDRLKDLSELIAKEAVRVRIELEIPDANGKFQTNIDSYIEAVPQSTFNGIAAYYAFHKKEFEDQEIEIGKIEEDFKRLETSLKRLPRVTRQFFSFMLRRGEWKDTTRFINDDYLRKVCSLPDIEGDIRLLTEVDLMSYREPDDHESSATWRLKFARKPNDDYFVWNVFEFLKSRSSDVDKLVERLDFSDFAS